MLKLSRKKILILVIIVLVFIGFFSYRNAQSKPTFTTTKVTKGDLIKTVSASGTVSAPRDGEIYALATGSIQNILTEDNANVSVGQSLVQLDPIAFSSAVASAKASIDTAAKTVEDLDKKTVSDSQKSALKAAVDQYERLFKESERTYNAGPTEGNQKALDAARANYETARKNYDEAFRQSPNELEYQAAKSSLNSAYVSYNKAVTDLNKAAVTAPVSGTFVLGTDKDGKKLRSGMSITTGQLLGQILDPASLSFVAELDENDIPYIQEGQKSTVILDAFGDKTLTTAVDEIDNSPTKTSSGATAYRVWVKLPTEVTGARLGMNGELEIEIERKNSVLQLPSETLKDMDGTDTEKKVEVLQNGKPVEKVVKVGMSNDFNTEVVEGLSEGDEVVLTKSK